MKTLTFLFLFLSGLIYAQEFKTPYEKGNGNQSTTYEEMVDFYQRLDQEFESISVIEQGKDDNGEPIRVVIYNPSTFQNAPLVLINNGIHPGEPDGIDATMMLMRDLAFGKIYVPKHLRVAAIEAYNISGMMRRGGFSRANQNGPEAYGFRGNARNFDLNRDFIKNDTENAKGFQEIFHILNPIFFIDNHVSNGADYAYTFTYISTNKERLGQTLGPYFHQEIQPQLIQKLTDQNILCVPYVNIHGEKPDDGFTAFMDAPRYATGYTTLFNVPGTVAETHMLKPYPARVKATYLYMKAAIHYVDVHAKEIQEKRDAELQHYLPENLYPIEWDIDSTQYEYIKFKGYEAGYKPSEVSGAPRLFYDRSRPFTRKVKFYNTYKAEKKIRIPKYYVVPKSEQKIIAFLKRNHIQMQVLTRDTSILVGSYQISDFKTMKVPYEGHYLHYDTEVTQQMKEIHFNKGDFLIPTTQNGVKYLLETLEPEAVDSFFNWNFLDGILNQKEYYSAYVFEDTAAALLKKNPSLKNEFEQKKTTDKSFATNGAAQLDWVYKHSNYYEGSVNQYPIYKIL